MVIYRKRALFSLLGAIYFAWWSTTRPDPAWWEIGLAAFVVLGFLVKFFQTFRQIWEIKEMGGLFQIRRNKHIIFQGEVCEITGIHLDSGDYILEFGDGPTRIVIPAKAKNPVFESFLEKVKISGHAAVASNV